MRPIKWVNINDLWYYYLLQAGEVSRWHRVDAAELWNWYAGAPLRLEICEDGGAPRDLLLGNGLAPKGWTPGP